jgi:rubrerythrin
MKPQEKSQFKELWRLRFEKLLKLERESIRTYESLLAECRSRYQDKPILQERFEKLIKDEKRHAKLVEELLSIVNRQDA